MTIEQQATTTKEKPNYWGKLPANVRYSKKVTANAKVLFSEITALSNKKNYCWASNKYFSDLYGKTPRIISQWISSLEKNGFIKCKLTAENRRIIEPIYV